MFPCAGILRGQRCWSLLELELRVTVSHPTSVLGTELRYSTEQYALVTTKLSFQVQMHFPP